MPTAIIDGLDVNYLTRGSGPPLPMLAPGGFDATIEKWVVGQFEVPSVSSSPTISSKDQT